MFQIIDILGYIHDCYGTFVDEYGDIQFILCDSSGKFYKTDKIAGFYSLYTDESKK